MSPSFHHLQNSIRSQPNLFHLWINLYSSSQIKSLIHKQLSLITKTRIRGLDAFNEALAARNKLYEASQQHHLEICDMKRQIKNLEEERTKLQEENFRLQKQLQTAQACKQSIFCPDFALSYQYLRYLPIRFFERPYSTNSSSSSSCGCG